MKTLRWPALCAAIFLLAACSRASDSGVRLATDDESVLATGRQIYSTRCAACHGANLQGQPHWRERDASGRLPAPPHDASGHTWHHPDQVLFDITKYGVARAAQLKDYDSAMPAFDGVLSDAQIVAVLSWIKSTWPPRIRDLQRQVDEAERNNKEHAARSP